MSLEFKIGKRKIRLLTNEKGFPIGIEGENIEENIARAIGSGFFKVLKEFTPEKEVIQAIAQAYLTTVIVSYDINWKFSNVLTCAMGKLEDGLFNYKLKYTKRRYFSNGKEENFFKYTPKESDIEFFKRAISKLETIDQINELSKTTMGCYCALMQRKTR